VEHWAAKGPWFQPGREPDLVEGVDDEVNPFTVVTVATRRSQNSTHELSGSFFAKMPLFRRIKADTRSGWSAANCPARSAELCELNKTNDLCLAG
jgi:hypothetical protein